LLTDPPRLRAEDIEASLQAFRGTYFQTPPPFSAKKIAGRRAYEHARRSEPVALAPVQVTVDVLELVAVLPDSIRLRISCSSGFYVRSLAHDLGRRLGCGAHLRALRRTRAGRFGLDGAVTLDSLEREGPAAAAHLVPLATLVDDFPAVTVSDEGARRTSHGNALGPGHLVGAVAVDQGSTRVRLLDAAGGLLAVAERGPDALLHPVVVLV
jgi:tRNA pseudouridine55 synthase